MAMKTFEYIWEFMEKTNRKGLDNISDEIMCILCKEILIDPCFGRCGCRYCLACITQYLSGEHVFCPGTGSDCKKQILDLGHPDCPASQKISRLIIKCPRDGCDWRCELRELEAHERVCKTSETAECPYLGIGCHDNRLANDMVNVHLIERNELHAQLLVDCIDSLKNEIKSMKRDLADSRGHEKMLDCLNEEVQMVKKTNKSILEDNISIKEENNYLKAELKRIQMELFGFSVKTERQGKKIENLNKEMQSVKNVNTSIMLDNKSIKEVNLSITDDNKSIHNYIDYLKSTLKRIRTEYSKLADFVREGFNQMDHSKKKKVPKKNKLKSISLENLRQNVNQDIIEAYLPNWDFLDNPPHRRADKYKI